MILGRSPSGAIKIKTDGDLRAVNCACCQAPCECPDSLGSPFVPPIAGEFEIDGSWSATTFRFSYNECGIAQSLLADGTSLSVTWQCFGGWYIRALNTSISPLCCQDLLGVIFASSPVGTFPIFSNCMPPDPSCEGYTVTITQIA